MIQLLFVIMFLVMLLAAIEIYGDERRIKPTWVLVAEVGLNVAIYIAFLALILVVLMEFIF